MFKFKLNLSDVVNNFYDPERQTIKGNKSDNILKHKISELQVKSSLYNLDTFDSKSSGKNSRVKESES